MRGYFENSFNVTAKYIKGFLNGSRGFTENSKSLKFSNKGIKRLRAIKRRRYINFPNFFSKSNVSPILRDDTMIPISFMNEIVSRSEYGEKVHNFLKR